MSARVWQTIGGVALLAVASFAGQRWGLASALGVFVVVMAFRLERLIEEVRDLRAETARPKKRELVPADSLSER